MSRSQPSERVPNPSTRWFEWNGQSGDLSYWEKESKTRIRIALPFTFLWLDELRTICGFDKPGNCRIYSNEVRDTTLEPFLVKSFKSGIVAEGKYRSIKPTVEAANAHFTASLYIAYKAERSLVYALGNLRLQRSALSAWVDFTKDRRTVEQITTKAITISGYTEDTSGRVVYRMPKFTLTEVSQAAQDAALALDNELQTYLSAYLKKTTTERAEAQVEAQPQDIPAEQIPF